MSLETKSEDYSRNKLSLVVFEKEDGESRPAGIKKSVFSGVEDNKPFYIDYFIPSVTSSAYNNLYGRLLTLVEATTDESKLKVVKTLFQRELNDWFDTLERSVEELDKDHTAGHGYYFKNLYVYENLKHGGRIIHDGDVTLDI